MFLKLAFVTFLYSTVFVAVLGQNSNYYCDDALSCVNENNFPTKNILCNNDFNMNLACLPSGLSKVPITNEIKEAILNGHNEKRNLIAEGRGYGVLLNEAATRMTTLVWDDELELIALAKALECKRGELKCMKTKRFPTPGLNYATITSSDILPAVNEMIDQWFDRHKFVTNFEWVESYGTDPSAPLFEMWPFTQMIWSNAVALGCSIVRFQTQIHIVCVYSSRIGMRGVPVYEVGQMASKCQRGVNPKYPGLCNVHEFPFPSSDSPLVNQRNNENVQGTYNNGFQFTTSEPPKMNQWNNNNQFPITTSKLPVENNWNQRNQFPITTTDTSVENSLVHNNNQWNKRNEFPLATSESPNQWNNKNTFGRNTPDEEYGNSSANKKSSDSSIGIAILSFNLFIAIIFIL